jgi:hypothetical protein
MAISRWPHTLKVPKDPDSVLDYRLSWDDWLEESEQIVSSTWTLSDGEEVESSFTARETTLWISGGTEGEELSMTNHIVTDSLPVAREEDRTLIVLVEQK